MWLKSYFYQMFDEFSFPLLQSTVPKSNGSEGAPNVEAALSTSPTAAAQIQAARKPTIGQRKTQAKKGGVSYGPKFSYLFKK